MRGARLRAAMAGQLDGVLLHANSVTVAAGASWRDVGDRLATAGAAMSAPGEIVVDYPSDESLFPPDLVAFDFGDGEKPFLAILPDRDPPTGEIDREVLGKTNEIYQPTEYPASARAWTRAVDVWDEVKRRSVKQMAVVTFFAL